MTTNTLSRIESILRDSQNLTPDQRAELLALLAKLREETVSLDTARAGAGHEIAAQTEALAERALEPGHDRESLKSAVSKLSETTREFEESHPRLVQVTNAICTALANMGI